MVERHQNHHNTAHPINGGNAVYAYVPNSNLLKSITTDSGLVTTYSYEPHRNLRTQIKNEYNTSIISQYDYANDTMGRRTSVKNSGTAFAQAAFNRYDYNDRSELTGSNRYNGIDISLPIHCNDIYSYYNPIRG